MPIFAIAHRFEPAFCENNPYQTLLMLKPLLFCLLFGLGQWSLAQTFKIDGRVQDTTNQLLLENASIVLLKGKDSTLVKFTRANANGNFSLAGLDSGAYILLLTYPGYADYVDMLTVNGNLNLGKLAMITKAVALQNVIVRGSPIRMRGDTLAYVADSFKVREGATVEDLLRKLPGIQVNSKGEITAQGEKVQKVLVDGEEFFGDDPTMATKNLQSSIVKEVQVFDRKSEQATFTGVDDGEKTKTINLKLKDEAQRGYFGKVNLAGGMPKNYNAEAMVNKFTKQKKISVFGLASNVNNAGLEWSDETNYGGGMSTQVNDDGGVSMWMTGDNIDYNNNNFNEGLPTAINIGGQFSNKWREDKEKLNGSYRFRQQGTQGGSNAVTQFVLPDTQYVNRENTDFRTQRFLNRANATYDFKIDSTQSLFISANGSYGKSELNGNFIGEALSPKGVAINQSTRQTTNTSFNSNINTNLLWRKKLKKKGRTISTSINQTFNNSNGNGFLRNYNQFFSNGQLLSFDTTDQKKQNKNYEVGLETRVAYTEPVGKKGIVELNYELGFTDAENEQLSFDKENDKYESLNANFSNSFRYKTLSHNIGTAYRFTDKKYNFQIGGNLLSNQWEQRNLIKDSTINRNFTNFNGIVNFYYKIKQQTGVRLNYNVNTTNPTINQLQPLADNNNPLNIMIGNPNLKLRVNHRLSASYNQYQVLGGRSLWTNFSFTPITNDISTLDSVDAVGRRFTQFINVAGNYSLDGYVDYSQEIKAWDLSVNIGLNYDKNVRHNIVNSQANKVVSNRLTTSVGLNKSKEDKFDISVEAEFGYNHSTSSIRADITTQFWTFEPNISLGLELPWKIRLETNANYYIRQRTEVFANNNNVLLWTGRINKKIGKKQDIRIGLMVNDILNQNQGFNREISTNFISERTNIVLRRYAGLTFLWNFAKNGKPQEW
ncbi:MAG: hypothetical protein EAY75_17355 [Bacteroidetes bacterium]|nr:MAG: hypothetical protein EAY75_17355 [Bacteroidota bacterium]